MIVGRERERDRERERERERERVEEIEGQREWRGCGQSGKSGTIQEWNQASGVHKTLYA